jgi:hypothetical protein
MAIDGRRAVTLSLEGPQPQRRSTVAFRIILAIPHLFWAALLGFVSAFAVLAAWFAALFTGHVPSGLGDFIARVLQYQTCLYAYLYLLTDTYPPFSLSPVDRYPAELDIEPPERLNRAAVFLRIILMVPGMIVSSLVGGGATIVLFVLWIITLISGRMPDSAFEALAVTLRYQLRFYAFAELLTSEQPSGLFGDRAAPSAVVDPATLPPPPEPFGSTPAPRLSTFVLSKAARRLVILFIILGVFSNAGSGVQAIDATNRTSASKKLDAEHDRIETSFEAFLADVQSCAAAADPACVRGANGRLIAALREFRESLRAIDVPNSAEDDKTLLDGDTTQMITLLDRLQETTDVTAYTETARRLGEVGNSFERDYEQLYRDALFG